MKKNLLKTIKVLSIPALVMLASSCSTPSYNGDEQYSSLADYSSVTVNTSISLSDTGKSVLNSSSFLRGSDMSFLRDIEANGGSFYDEDNNKADALSILKADGMNTVRLRLWVDPYGAAATPSLENYGYNTLEKTAVMAKRCRNLGLKVLLDLHYSDTWAHPGQQLWPSSFEGATTIDSLCTKVSRYTKSSLEYLEEQGALPDLVQIGNEIDSGMFLQTSANKTASLQASYGSGSSNLIKVLNAAGKAVKDVDSGIEVIIHVAAPANYSRITGLGLDSDSYDAIGVSYYPCIKSRALSDLGSAIQSIVNSGKKAYVLETSFPYTCEWVEGKNDSTNNTVWYTGTQSTATAYTNLSSSASSYSIETTTYEESSVIASTTGNQAAVLRAVYATVAEAGGSGVFYWGGDWTSTTSIPSTWENQALFDTDGKVLPAAKIFGLVAE